jgi:hypothetical protein
MPRLGFEPTIPAVERTKTLHALDRAANVIGYIPITPSQFYLLLIWHTENTATSDLSVGKSGRDSAILNRSIKHKIKLADNAKPVI